MPLFHVTGHDVYQKLPWQALIEAETAAAADAFVTARNIAPLTVVLRADEAGLPVDILRMRVPAVVVAGPSTPLARRMKLVAIGVGIALFVIAGFLFVNRAKEHLLRGDLRPKEVARPMQGVEGERFGK